MTPDRMLDRFPVKQDARPEHENGLTVCPSARLTGFRSDREALAAEEQRRRCSLAYAPALSVTGIPVPRGGRLTTVDAPCWLCGDLVLAGYGELLRGTPERVECPGCVWSDAYKYLWPDLTPAEAVLIARLCMDPEDLEMAYRAGYNATEVLTGALTEDVIAGLPVAAALNQRTFLRGLANGG